jgi:hypothetical protein
MAQAPDDGGVKRAGNPRRQATGRRTPCRAGRPGSRRSGVPLKRAPERRPAQRHQPPAVGDQSHEAGIRRPRSPGDPPATVQKVREDREHLVHLGTSLVWWAFMLLAGRAPGTALSRGGDEPFRLPICGVPGLVAHLGDGQDPDFLLKLCTRPSGREECAPSTAIRSRSRGVWHQSLGAPDEGVRGYRARTYWVLGLRSG